MKEIKKIKLWGGNPPTHNELFDTEIVNSEEILEIVNITEPELTIYSPEEANNTGVAVIICPGGAYAGLAITSQGYDFADWLVNLGITAAVLKYRMPNGHQEVPLDDLQESIRYLRKNFKNLGINKNKIGVAGFSAGGHLAALASTLFSLEGISTRPDFSMLFYPVISMGLHTQEDTHQNLLGKQPSPDTIGKYSCQKQVRAGTPPTLILVSDDDTVVSPLNSILYYEALKKHNIPATLYLFPQGNHAWGIKGNNMFGEKFDYLEEAKVLIMKWLLSYY